MGGERPPAEEERAPSAGRILPRVLSRATRARGRPAAPPAALEGPRSPAEVAHHCVLVLAPGVGVRVCVAQDPSKVAVYTEHTAPVRAAKFSPSGYWVASGDTSGKVRVWAWNREDHLLKKEHSMFAGEVEDVAWDGESKRLLAVGGGRDKAKVVQWDAGNSLGEITAVGRKALTCDMKPSRPFALAFSGEDWRVAIYKGPPFKLDHYDESHKNFVNCIRYSPDGAHLVSVSSDKTARIYSGDGVFVGELEPAGEHTGSIYSVAWSPDSARVATASGDKTVKIWAAATSRTLESSLTFGADADAMQNAIVWPTADTIVSLSLNGNLNFFPPGAEAPARVVEGHSAPASALAIDRTAGRIVTGDTAGRVCIWTPTSELHDTFVAQASPAAHRGKVVATATSGGQYATIGFDDHLRIGTLHPVAELSATPVGAQPRGLAVSAAHPSLRVVITSALVLLFHDGAKVAEVAAGFEPTSVDVTADGRLVAVGAKDGKVRFFTLNAAAHTLEAAGETPDALGGAVASLAFSPDGAHLAVGDAVKEVAVYSAASPYAAVRRHDWVHHTSRVTSVAWNPSGSLLASVSTDRRLCVWKVAEARPVVKTDLAHSQPFVAAAWADDASLWTVGLDGLCQKRPIVIA